MKRRLRKKVKIRGVNWTIKVIHGLTDSNGREVMGLCSNETKTIYVEADLSRHEFIETLFHEFMHACFFEASLEDYMEDFNVEHVVINSVAKEVTLLSSFWSEVFRLSD